MSDAWVWDMYRPARFVKNVRVLTFKDVNVEELARHELSVELPGGASRRRPSTGPAPVLVVHRCLAAVARAAGSGRQARSGGGRQR